MISLGILFLIGCGNSIDESKNQNTANNDDSLSFQEGERYSDKSKPSLNAQVFRTSATSKNVKVDRKATSSKRLIAFYGKENTRSLPEATAQTVVNSSKLQAQRTIKEKKEHLLSVFSFKKGVYTLEDTYYVEGKHKEETKILGNFIALFTGRNNETFIYSFADPRKSRSFNFEKYPDKIQENTEGSFDIKIPVNTYENAIGATIYMLPKGIELGSEITKEVKEKILNEGRKITEINLLDIQYALNPIIE
jgi:hypothetical protein